MSVARETILTALEAMKELEELSVANLTAVSRYDFSGFSPEQQEKIAKLLHRLTEDTFRHEDMIDLVVRRLRP